MCGEWGEWKCQKVNLHEHTQCTEINSQRSGGCLEGTAALIQSKTSCSMAFRHHNVVHTKKEKKKGGGGVVFLHLSFKTTESKIYSSPNGHNMSKYNSQSYQENSLS